MANDFIIDKILAQVLMFPETHDQDMFMDTAAQCGTTFCVAGWAVHFSDEYEIIETGNTGYPVRKRDHVELLWSESGQDILGITEDQANHLFFETNNEEAISYLKDLKNGI